MVEANLKVLTRLYLVPTWLAKMYPSVSPLCFRDCQMPGTMCHIWWECSRIYGFWNSIFALIRRVTGQSVPKTPYLVLLNAPVSVRNPWYFSFYWGLRLLLLKPGNSLLYPWRRLGKRSPELCYMKILLVFWMTQSKNLNRLGSRGLLIACFSCTLVYLLHLFFGGMWFGLPILTPDWTSSSFFPSFFPFPSSTLLLFLISVCLTTQDYVGMFRSFILSIFYKILKCVWKVFFTSVLRMYSSFRHFCFTQ